MFRSFVRVLAIGKLKCLNYLIRTFGVRNLLPTLLGDGGRDAYLHRVERLPAPLRPTLVIAFSRHLASKTRNKQSTPPELWVVGVFFTKWARFWFQKLSLRPRT